MRLTGRPIPLALVGAACLLAAGCGSARQQSAPSAASEIETIRALRLAQNDAIRAHDLDAIVEVLEESVQVTSGIGIHVTGRDAYRQAYEQDFEVLEDVAYTRNPDQVEISSFSTGLAERIAWESGTWTGSWIGPRGPTQMRGTYSAMWRKRNGRWRINSELFVSLACSGEGCPRG